MTGMLRRLETVEMRQPAIVRARFWTDVGIILKLLCWASLELFGGEELVPREVWGLLDL